MSSEYVSALRLEREGEVMADRLALLALIGSANADEARRLLARIRLNENTLGWLEGFEAARERYRQVPNPA